MYHQLYIYIYIWGTDANIICVNIILSNLVMTYWIIILWKNTLVGKNQCTYYKSRKKTKKCICFTSNYIYVSTHAFVYYSDYLKIWKVTSVLFFLQLLQKLQTISRLFMTFNSSTNVLITSYYSGRIWLKSHEFRMMPF